MCDYSLMAVPNRLANQGEDLVAHRFPTGSMGLASPADLKPVCNTVTIKPRGFWNKLKNFLSPPVWQPVAAVCIPPGARLWLGGIPEQMQKSLKVGPEEDVTFTQISAAVNTYRDAVQFCNGRQLRLQELREGQPVKVLDLSLSETPEPLAEEYVRHYLR
jgi:hypothetical protein